MGVGRWTVDPGIGETIEKVWAIDEAPIRTGDGGFEESCVKRTVEDGSTAARDVARETWTASGPFVALEIDTEGACGSLVAGVLVLAAWAALRRHLSSSAWILGPRSMGAGAFKISPA